MPSVVFNHASCQCETYYSVDESKEVFWMVELVAKFHINKLEHAIIIEHTPRIIV